MDDASILHGFFHIAYNVSVHHSDLAESLVVESELDSMQGESTAV